MRLTLSCCKKYTTTIIAISLVVLVTIGSVQYSVKLGFPQAQGQQLTPEQEKNKALVKGFLNEVFITNKNVSAVDKYFSNNFVSHVPNFKDKESHKQVYSRALTAFPDLKGRIDDIIAEGDKVAVFTTWNGTLQPLNKPVSFKIADLFRLSNGKIVEHSEVSDYRQLDRVLANSTSNPFQFFGPSAIQPRTTK
jgi:predicted SnoaL-like aldol condensation-catalyzing enzyme